VTELTDNAHERRFKIPFPFPGTKNMQTRELAARLGCTMQHARRLKAKNDPRVAAAEAAWRDEQKLAADPLAGLKIPPPPEEEELRFSQKDIEDMQAWHEHLEKRFGPTRRRKSTR
jgi:hypothetical protein